MRYHIIAFFFGFLLDLAFGDPYFLPHPVRLMGKLINAAEKGLRGRETEGGRRREQEGWEQAEFKKGIWLVILVLVSVTTVAWLILAAAYRIHPYAGMAAETLMTYQILAVECLKVESMKVFSCLQEGDLERARQAVSMIVGRDTDSLDEEGVAKAAIETVAENTSDGVIAPMLYLALGGPVLGFFYKAVNTMDSMVGYKNGTYLYFGRAAARLDDFVNYIPARIGAWLMIAASFLLECTEGRKVRKKRKIQKKRKIWKIKKISKRRKIPERLGGSETMGKTFSGRNALAVYRRDRRKHASPNSAQTESVCAGALGIRLAGDASYFGKTVRKPYIGDALRKAEGEDIRRANRLMYMTAWLGELLCLSGLLVWLMV